MVQPDIRYTDPATANLAARHIEQTTTAAMGALVLSPQLFNELGNSKAAAPQAPGSILSDEAAALRVMQAGDFSNASVDAAKTLLAGDGATFDQVRSALNTAIELRGEA